MVQPQNETPPGRFYSRGPCEMSSAAFIEEVGGALMMEHLKDLTKALDLTLPEHGL